MRLLTTSTLFLLPSLLLASSPEQTQTDTATSTQTSQHYNNLDLRQGVGAAGGQANPYPGATQMSPITTYLVHGANGQLVPIPYTQVFVKVPDQWPAPTAGVIGLGGVTGAVGTVRPTRLKRSLALPTGLVERVEGVIGFVGRGAEEGWRGVRRSVSKKKKGTGGSSANGAACGNQVSLWVMAGAVGVGLGVVVGL